MFCYGRFSDDGYSDKQNLQIAEEFQSWSGSLAADAPEDG
jgi:hypothetical protein